MEKIANATTGYAEATILDYQWPSFETFKHEVERLVSTVFPDAAHQAWLDLTGNVALVMCRRLISGSSTLGNHIHGLTTDWHTSYGEAAADRYREYAALCTADVVRLRLAPIADKSILAFVDYGT